MQHPPSPPPSDTIAPQKPGRDAPASTAWVRDQRLEEVRRAMLACMAGLQGSDVARVCMRLRYAGDIEALWYLRTDMHLVVGTALGNDAAEDMMRALTARFQGLLPRTLGYGHLRPQA